VSDLWTIMRTDHGHIWAMVSRLTGASCGRGTPQAPPQQRRLLRELTAVAASHDAAEDLVVWPAVRQLCRGGDELAAEAEEQENRIKRALSELEHLPPGEDGCYGSSDIISGLIRAHFRYEQDRVWPRLAEQLTSADVGHLTAQWRTAQWLTARRQAARRPPAPSSRSVAATARADAVAVATSRG
jgi:hypothetical protein